MSDSTKQRVEWIDFAKALGIYLVVLGHCYPVENPSPLVRNFIYLFHMPLFFFLSGCTFKVEDDLRSVLRKIMVGLCIPTLAWSLVYSVWYGILIGNGDVSQRLAITWDLICHMGTGIVFERGLPCGPTWFLIALAWCRLMFWMIAKARSWWVGGVLWVIALMATRHHSYAWIGSAVMAIPFFGAGYICMKHREKIDLLWAWFQRRGREIIFAVLAIAILMSAKTWYGATSILGRSFGNHIMPLRVNVVVMYFFAFVGISLIIIFARRFSVCSKWEIGRGGGVIGRSSLIIMCLHNIFCEPIRLITSQWTFTGFMVRAAVACIILALCNLISQWLIQPNFNWLIGKANIFSRRKEQ